MPAADSTPRAILRNVLIVVGVVLALYLIYLLRKPIGWLLIATFLAIALSGPVNYLNRYMKRGFAIGLVYLMLLSQPDVNHLGYHFPQLHPGCTGCAACLFVCPDFCFEIYQYEKPVVHEVSP